MAAILPLRDLGCIGGILCHGCFDMIHIGHIRHFREARDINPIVPLTVTVTSDKYITKGFGRPAFSESVRAEWLSSIECIDYVSIVDDPTAVPAILTIRPRYYVKGGKYEKSGVIEQEREALVYVGGFVVYTIDHRDGVSSTSLLTGKYLQDKMKGVVCQS